jgi:hypothetical protein
VIVWAYKTAMSQAGPGRGLEDYGEDW